MSKPRSKVNKDGDSEKELWAGRTVDELLRDLDVASKPGAAKHVRRAASSVWGESQPRKNLTIFRHPAFPLFVVVVALLAFVIAFYSKHGSLEDYEAALVAAFLAAQAAALAIAGDSAQGKLTNAYRTAVTLIPCGLGVGLIFASHGTDDEHSLRVGAIFFVVACVFAFILDLATRAKRYEVLTSTAKALFAVTALVIVFTLVIV